MEEYQHEDIILITKIISLSLFRPICIEIEDLNKKQVLKSVSTHFLSFFKIVHFNIQESVNILKLLLEQFKNIDEMSITPKIKEDVASKLELYNTSLRNVIESMELIINQGENNTLNNIVEILFPKIIKLNKSIKYLYIEKYKEPSAELKECNNCNFRSETRTKVMGRRGTSCLVCGIQNFI